MVGGQRGISRVEQPVWECEQHPPMLWREQCGGRPGLHLRKSLSSSGGCTQRKDSAARSEVHLLTEKINVSGRQSRPGMLVRDLSGFDLFARLGAHGDEGPLQVGDQIIDMLDSD